MVRRLEMHKTQGIEHLFATGMSKRKIARTLGIDRKSVDRHLAGIPSKGASLEKSPTEEAPTGLDDPKGAKAPTGSQTENGDQNPSRKPVLRTARSRFEFGQASLLGSPIFRQATLPTYVWWQVIGLAFQPIAEGPICCLFSSLVSSLLHSCRV